MLMAHMVEKEILINDIRNNEVVNEMNGGKLRFNVFKTENSNYKDVVVSRKNC